MRKRELLLGLVLIIIVFSILMLDQPMHGLKKYDCSIAEISPDYPVEVKDACRRIRAEKRKE